MEGKVRADIFLRESGGEIIAERGDWEFRTLEIVTEIDKIEILAELEPGTLEEISGVRVPTVEDRDRRRRRVHRALTRFAEEERGVIAKGSGVWEVDESCEEMASLLKYLDILLEKDRDGDLRDTRERFIDWMYDAGVRADHPVPSPKSASADSLGVPADFIDEISGIIVKISGRDGLAHISEIYDTYFEESQGVDEGSGEGEKNIDKAVASLVDSGSIVESGEGEYKVNTQGSASFWPEVDIGMSQGMSQFMNQQMAFMRDMTHLSEGIIENVRSRPDWGVMKGENEEEALWLDGQKRMSDLKIGKQLQSVFEKEVKKGHWPMKSMKQKATEGEIPLVKWKIHEFVMDILWENYLAETRERSEEAAESDSDYKAPGYLPTSQITSNLKSKFREEKSDGRMSQVLGDLCGLGVLKSERVEGGRGKKYKLTTKGRVMMKSAENAADSSGRLSRLGRRLSFGETLEHIVPESQ